ncbi:MAG TPA: type II secretion system F family protein [Candidatus Acidoferrales bacterium]|nr:type II secretion system F family protein [Candidatus Acidoferrales bacterium]
MAFLIATMTFLLVAVILIFIWMSVGTDKNQELVRRRMESVQKAEKRGEVSLSLKLVRDEMMSSVPALHRLMMRWSWASKLREILVQAGMEIKPAKLVLISAALTLSGYLICGYFYPRLPVQIFLAAALGVAPFLFVLWKRRRRIRQFEERFPEALDLLGRAVRAGHAFTTGLEMIAKEASEPVASEFRKTFEEQNFGIPLRDALLNMSERIHSLDAKFFVTALLIQKETGGNLAEILDGLARVIRDRFRIYRDVRTKTAQGRLTAGILIALPPVMMLALGALNPHYMKILFTDPKGPIILLIAGIMQILGSVVIWKVIHFEV